MLQTDKERLEAIEHKYDDPDILWLIGIAREALGHVPRGTIRKGTRKFRVWVRVPGKEDVEAVELMAEDRTDARTKVLEFYPDAIIGRITLGPIQPVREYGD